MEITAEAAAKKMERSNDMEYPQKVMKITDMQRKLGFPREYLLRAFRVPNQTFARKLNPVAPNSPIIFDTEGFERWRINDGRNCR